MMLLYLLNVILPLFLFGRISNFMKGKGYSGKGTRAYRIRLV